VIGVSSQAAGHKTLVPSVIAELEKIEVSNNEIMGWVATAARENDMTVERVVKEMRKRRVFAQVRSDILTSKALDFVVSNATVTVEGAA
jgi:methylmalonyl-CoA mutase cobalamin-binding subunit